MRLRDSSKSVRREPRSWRGIFASEASSQQKERAMSNEKKKPEVEIKEGFPEFGEHFGLILEVEPPACPECGSTDFAPIAYGYPTPELFDEEGTGNLKLGGCVETAGVSPRWFCNLCQHAWR
jgi:hypothetical protein